MRRLLALSTVAAGLLAAAPAAHAMTIQVVNNSGLADSDVYVQLVPLGGGSGYSGITPNTAVPLSSLTNDQFSFSTIDSGRIIVSYGGPVPSNVFPAAPPATVNRWDMVELTVNNTPYDTADLTAVEWFGIPLQVQAVGSTQTPSTLGWTSDYDTIAAAMTGIGAVAEQTPGGDTAGFVAPSIVPGSYADLTPYVASLQGQALSVTDTFAGQQLSFTGSVGTDNSVTMTGSYGGASHSMVIPGANISTAIYSGSTSFTVDGAPGKLYDDNQWYSQLFVDVINGFSLGQWGGKNGDTLNAVTPSSSPNWYGTQPYGAANVAGHYNAWGAVVAQYGNAFQSPFSQSPALPASMQPQLPIGGVSTLTVTLPPDHVASTVTVSAAVARFGSAGAARTLTVRNTGDTLAHVSRVRLAGGDARHFAVAANGCSRRALMPGERCRVKVRYRPRSSGPHAARLVVRHDGRGGKRVVRLRGHAT
jgi:hypothetical protein